MKINALRLNLDYIDKAIDTFCNKIGKYPEYIIMNSETLNMFTEDVKEHLKFYNDNHKFSGKVCYYKGFSIALCENLSVGDIDIR